MGPSSETIRKTRKIRADLAIVLYKCDHQSCYWSRGNWGQTNSALGIVGENGKVACSRLSVSERLKKQAADEWGLVGKKESSGEPVSIVLKTLFWYTSSRPLLLSPGSRFVARSLFRSSSLTESLEQANGKVSNIDISTENAMLQTILSTNMTEHVITQIKGNLVTVTATELVSPLSSVLLHLWIFHPGEEI